MKIAVVGGREFNDYELLSETLNEELKDHTDVTIISGGAKGTDTLAKRYAEENNLEFMEFPANWKEFGTSAGVIRNKEMIKEADLVVAFWDGISKGTKSTIVLASRARKECKIIDVPEPEPDKIEKFRRRQY